MNNILYIIYYILYIIKLLYNIDEYDTFNNSFIFSSCYFNTVE